MPDTKNLNPRWVLCAQALGLDPTPREPGDDTLRIGYLSALTFTLWLSPRWEEFRKEWNMRRDSEAMADSAIHGAFDAWLRAGVEAGKWKDNPMDDRRAA